MNIRYDSEADAMYIKLKKGKIDATREEEMCLVDYDKEGNMLGIEIINCAKKGLSIKGEPHLVNLVKTQ